MPLNLCPNIRASGSVPAGWVAHKQSPRKFPVYDSDVLQHLRSLSPGKWQKVIKTGNAGDVHYFEHQSGNVAGVKFYEK